MESDFKQNWRDSDLNVDSLWIINERDKNGKHSNIYHGNFIPQIPNQLLKRYTTEGDVVLELFTGSGTTLYECESLRRNYIGFDINSRILEYVSEKMKGCDTIRFALNECDVTDTVSFDECVGRFFDEGEDRMVDFVIAHPPYLDIVKFTDDQRDLSHISDISCFKAKFILSLQNALKYLKKGKYFAFVAGDVYKNSEVVPFAFHMMDAVKASFNVKLKGIIVKNIEGNRGKLGAQDIWKYRALKSDYFLFKHEYIFVFKKM